MTEPTVIPPGSGAVVLNEQCEKTSTAGTENTEENQGPSAGQSDSSRDDKKYAMELPAWKWYMDPHVLGNKFRARNFVALPELEKLSEALGRMVTLEEVQLLVVPDDGGKQECAACHVAFNPVRWAIVNDKLLERVRKEGKIDQEFIFYVGQFFLHDKDEEILCFCGSPFLYAQDSREEETRGKPFLNRTAHLTMAREQNIVDGRSQWGYPHWRAMRSLQFRKEERQKQEFNVIGELLGKRSGKERGEGDHHREQGKERRKDYRRHRNEE